MSKFQVSFAIWFRIAKLTWNLDIPSIILPVPEWIQNPVVDQLQNQQILVVLIWIWLFFATHFVVLLVGWFCWYSINIESQCKCTPMSINISIALCFCLIFLICIISVFFVLFYHMYFFWFYVAATFAHTQYLAAKPQPFPLEPEYNLGLIAEE